MLNFVICIRIDTDYFKGYVLQGVKRSFSSVMGAMTLIRFGEMISYPVEFISDTGV